MLSHPALALLAALLLGACRSPERPARLRIGFSDELTTLHPHAQNSVGHFAVHSHLYDALVTLNADLGVEPGLAQSWSNPDLLTWAFRLRPGVRFQGGRPLRARDVVSTFETLRRDPSLEMGAYLRDVEEVEAPDDTTVVLRTRRPTPILLAKLSFVLVIPEGSTAETLARTPAGTGPYRLEEWAKGGRVRLRRSEGYWGSRPAFDEVVLDLALDPAEVLRRLLAGELDLGKSSLRRLDQAASAHLGVARRESIYVQHLGLDLARPPFQDPVVRHAVELALDRARLVEGLVTAGVPANELVPSFIFGFAPRLPAPSHDLERARRLLAQAGLAGGFDVVLHARQRFLAAASGVASQLAAAGIRVRVEAQSDAALHERMGQGHATFWLSRWGCQTGDAGDLLENLAHTPDPERHLGLYNWGGAGHPELDAPIEAASAVDAAGQRQARLQAALGAFAARRALVPLYVDRDGYGFDRRLTFRPRADGLIRAAEIGFRGE